MHESQLFQQKDQLLIEVKDNSGRAKTVMIVFGVLTGLALIGVLAGYNKLQILKKAQFGEYVSEQEANSSDLMQGIIGLVQIGLYIASVVVFSNWFRRAYGNLHRVGINYIQHKESMAVWTWFIPIVCFYRPVQLMNEIWTETQRKIKKIDSSYAIKNGGLILGLWWTLFVLSNFIGRYVLKTAFKQDTVEHLIESSEATMISDILQIPEALLVILIVYKLSKMESKLAEESKKLTVSTYKNNADLSV